jgi:hypothetical protein
VWGGGGVEEQLLVVILRSAINFDFYLAVPAKVAAILYRANS